MVCNLGSVTTGQRIVKWRAVRGLSQAQLAERTKMARYRLCRIEKGKTRALVDDIDAVAGALGISTTQFLGRIPSSKAA